MEGYGVEGQRGKGAAIPLAHLPTPTGREQLRGHGCSALSTAWSFDDSAHMDAGTESPASCEAIRNFIDCLQQNSSIRS